MREKRLPQKKYTWNHLTVSPQRKSVVLLPSVSSASLGVVELVALVDTSGLLASSSKTTGLTVLVNGVADPVVSGIVSDGSMAGVDENNLKVLVGSVLVNPVTVQHTQVAGTSTDTLLSGSTQRALVLELVDTLVGRLAVSGHP